MIYLFCMMIPYLLGRGALRALYGKTEGHDLTRADSVLAGGLVVIGLAEAAHMGAVVLGRSFSDCVLLFLVGLVALLAVAVVLILVEKHGKRNKLSEKEAERLRVKRAMTQETDKLTKWGVNFVFLLIVLIQILLMVLEGVRYLDGDMTVEMVNSTLSTNTVYQVNPMTGQPYTLGMPLRLKILCLPTLYAILCDLFGMAATEVVWMVVPVFTLLGSYAAFYTVAKALFAEDQRKQGIFMLFVALLLWIGDYSYGMDGFGVLYAGFRGVSIRMGILVPYTIGLVLRKKWKLVALCILAEACIVWTLYGLGACLFVAAGMIVVGSIKDKLLFPQLRNKYKKKQHGEEGDSE